MAIFDLLFSEWAESNHLRNISKQLAHANRREDLKAKNKNKTAAELIQQIETLENDVASLSLITFCLIATLENNNLLAHEDISRLVDEADALDGIRDGKISPDSLKVIFQSLLLSNVKKAAQQDIQADT